jgi:hypothetical protein
LRTGGFPTVPMTRGAQPCVPPAPWGAADASTILRAIAGRVNAISCATKLPIENPSRSTCARSSASMSAMASFAIAVIVLGVAPVEPATPGLSNVMTPAV